VFRFRPLLGCALALAVVLPACGALQRPAIDVHGVAIDDATVKATLPESQVLTSLLQQQCGTQLPGEPSHSPCVRYTVGFLIQRQIVRAYAQEHDIAVQPDDVRLTIAAIEHQFGPDQVRQLLKTHGVSQAEFERLISEQLLVGKVEQAVASSAISEGQLRAEYRRERARFTLLHAAHILVNTKQEADRISDQVTPQNFADLAKKYSIDKGSAASGGDLGTVPVGQLDPTFVNAALALQPGQISAPVHTQFGWHIIRLISKKTSPYASVRSQLLQELSGPVVQTWFRDQLADVHVDPRYGRLDPATGQIVPIDTTSTALPSPTATPTGL
jgi:parvulin-like peptidyl-prolyl isomerase